MIKNNLIESIVKEVILEYGGVSNDIMKISMTIFNLIYEHHREYRGQTFQIGDKKIYSKTFNLDINNIQTLSFLNGITVNLYYYNPQNETFDDVMDFISSNGYLKNNFAPSNRVITFSFVWAMTDVIPHKEKNYIVSTINHEIKHAYQSYKRGGTNITPQYSKAQSEMNKKFGFNPSANTPMKQIVDFTIPWIYYRLDRDEIDAWVQEMYMESQYENDIRDTKTYKMLSGTIKDYKLLKRVYVSKDDYYTKDNTKEYIDASIRRIDEPKNYFKLCDANISYLIKKMRRVIGRWNEENGTARGSFKKYSSKEIPQGDIFVKRNKGIYDILKNWYRNKLKRSK